MKKSTIVYRIENTVTKKSYIGSSWRMTKRWERHFKDLKYKCHHSSRMQADYDAHGRESFVLEILGEYDHVDAARDAENEFISKFNSFENGYNMTPNSRYYVWSPEEKSKHNAFMKEHWNTDVMREYARARAKKQFSDPAARQAASEKQKEFMARDPEKALAISSAGGKKGGPIAREKTRKEIIRSDGKKYLAIIDAAKEMAVSNSPEDIERARCRIKQVLRIGGRTFGYLWKYAKK